MNVDLDFQRYVERRRGASEAQAREGAAYAYAGDQRVRRTLDGLRPVRMALEATVRLWQTTARGELLGGALKVSAQTSPRVHAVVERAVAALHITAPTVYIAPQLGHEAHAFGADEEAYLVIGQTLVDELNDAELLFVVGHECGAVQNGHVVYATANYYLRHFANRFLQWIVRPATAALSSWARRGEITADRAGLICTRDVDVAQAALLKRALGSTRFSEVNGEAFLRQLDMQETNAAQPLEVTELVASHPDLAKRVRALRLFSTSSYFRSLVGGDGGVDQAACDTQVAELLGQ